MTTIASLPTNSYNTALHTNSASNRVEQQPKAQEQRDKIKPVAEQVLISKQAQQQYDTYTASAQNANNRYDTTASNSQPNGAEQAQDTLKTVQNRQTARALAEYAQQQSAESTPKPEPRESAKPTASIQAIA